MRYQNAISYHTIQIFNTVVLRRLFNHDASALCCGLRSHVAPGNHYPYCTMIMRKRFTMYLEIGREISNTQRDRSVVSLASLLAG